MEDVRWVWNWHTLRLKRNPHDPLALGRRLDALERADWSPIVFLSPDGLEAPDPNQGSLL